MLRWTLHLDHRVGAPNNDELKVVVGHKVYSFGLHWNGRQKDPTIDTHIFNTVSMRWMQLPPVTAENEQLEVIRSATYEQTAVLIEHTIYIWGNGLTVGIYTLYAFDVDTHRWFKPRVSGTIPEERGNHSACVLGKVMYIHGGYNKVTGNDNDMYKLHTTKWSGL